MKMELRRSLFEHSPDVLEFFGGLGSNRIEVSPTKQGCPSDQGLLPTVRAPCCQGEEKQDRCVT